MKFHIITLFPESFTSFLQTSIIKRAYEQKLFEVHFYKLYDYSSKKYRQVDDKAYGMHGQVLSPEPLAKALDEIIENHGALPTYYFTPRGTLLKQSFIENLEKNEHECILVCGHYEGIDERILELYSITSISIGNFVLSGGELPAQIFIDAMVRHIPGALGNIQSLKEESFSELLQGKKEYPLYTRPAEFRGLKVPSVLLSGNHHEIEKWKYTNLG